MLALLIAALLQVQDAEEDLAPPAEPPVSTVAMELLEVLPPSLEAIEARLAPQAGGFTLGSKGGFDQVGREDLGQPFILAAPPRCSAAEGGTADDVFAAARGAQIVIVDESVLSDATRHRAFLVRLIVELEGEFDIFASTHFSPLRLEPRGAGALGPYDKEPIFARVVAAADAHEYRLVSIAQRWDQRSRAREDRNARLNRRTRAHLDNLFSAVLEDDPDARVLIHLGVSRATERAPESADAAASRRASLRAERGPDVDALGLGGGEPLGGSLAWRLRERTGIAPLTITQGCVIASEPSQAAPEQGAAAISARGAGTSNAPGWPGALGAPASLHDGGSFDFAIAYPPPSFTDLRPDWRRAFGDREVAVPDALLPADRAVILEARGPGQPLTAMPIERLLLYPGEVAPLLLPPGEWVITGWTVDGAQGEPMIVTAD